MMDFKKLSRISDKDQVVSVEGLEISESSNPLDNLDVRTKVTDSKRKFIVLDNVELKRIMNLSSSDRRKILSKLSDSQRRRVLSQIAKIRDDESLTKLDLVNIDNVITNYAFGRDEFNKSLLSDFVNKYSSDESYSVIINVINELLNTGVVSEGARDAYYDLCNSLGVDTYLDDALTSSGIVEENKALSEEDILQITEDAENDAIRAMDGDFTEDMSEDTISKYVQKGLSYAAVSEVYNDAFNAKYKVAVDSLKINVQNLQNRIIMDEAIDDLGDLPLKDDEGNELDSNEDKSALELLTEALNAYMEGNDEPLQSLSNTSLDNEEVENDKPEETEVTENESEEVSLNDAVKLATAILKRENINKLIDNLQSRVPILSKVNLRINDCDLQRSECEECGTPVNVPLTRPEFIALSQIPEYLCNLCPSVECPPISNYSADNGVCIVTNPDDYAQSWYPTTSFDEVLASLQGTQDPKEWQRIISSSCVPLSSLMTIASKTNNLNFVDDAFYKKSLADSGWSFDEIPSCLKDINGVKPNGKLTLLTRFKKTDSTVVNILGQDYVLSY